MSLADLPAAEQDRRAARDAKRLVALARSSARLAKDIASRAPRWTGDGGTEILPADERAAALSLFDRVLDHQLAYDAISNLHMGFWRIDPLGDGPRHARHFALGAGAYLGRLALGMELVGRTLGNARVEPLLDEGAAELGIPPGGYELLRDDVTELDHVPRVVAAGQYHDLLKGSQYPVVCADEMMDRVVRDLDRAYARVAERMAKDGARLVFGGALEVLRGVARWAFFPIQAGVAEWMGDTRVGREGALISPEQIAEAARQCRSGDILVERRNWYLSNIGLPGFWPHAAMWIGTREDLGRLDRDPEVASAFPGGFVPHLSARFPEALAALGSPDEGGHPRVVLEAVSEGVVLGSAEHSLAADYAAALRPRAPALEVARAIERAFEYYGRPYDFDFDFVTDSALVCSELVFKAWEPRAGVRGLRFELEEILGRPTLPPNRMVAQFDREHGTAGQQLDFVWFLDGSEAEKAARFAALEDFRASHRRPKWDLAQK